LHQFSDTIETQTGEIDVIVEFDHQPHESDTNTPESIEITAVKYRGINCLEKITKEQLSIIEMNAWNHLGFLIDAEEAQEFDNWHNKHKQEV